MENEFTIKETANAIGQTVQNLYRKIPELKKLGYAREDENGNKFITIEGVNYLRDKIINSKRPTKEEERQEQGERKKQRKQGKESAGSYRLAEVIRL